MADKTLTNVLPPVKAVDLGDGTHAVAAQLQAGSALVGKVGIDQTTPGTTNGVADMPVIGSGVSIPETTLDDAPTSVTGADVAVSTYRKLGIFLELDSTLTPTDIQIFLDFKIGADYHTYDEDFWGALIFEDTRVAAGVKYAYTAPVVPGATHARLRAVATGTDATNTFKVKGTIGGYN